MPLAAEMHPFQGEVRGEQDLRAGRTCQDGCIVPDPGADPAGGEFGLAPEAANQFFFCQRQGYYTLQCRAAVRHMIFHSFSGQDRLPTPEAKLEVYNHLVNTNPTVVTLSASINLLTRSAVRR